jgi:hypothetical protein
MMGFENDFDAVVAAIFAFAVLLYLVGLWRIS